MENDDLIERLQKQSQLRQGGEVKEDKPIIVAHIDAGPVHTEPIKKARKKVFRSGKVKLRNAFAEYAKTKEYEVAFRILTHFYKEDGATDILYNAFKAGYSVK